MTTIPRPTKVSDFYNFISKEIAKSIESEKTAAKCLAMLAEAVQVPEENRTPDHHTLEDLLNLMRSNLEKNIASQTATIENLIQLAKEADESANKQ